MRPLIALPSRRTEHADTWRVPATAVGRTYLEAIVRAGGQPAALPPIGDTLEDMVGTLARFDGLCLPGGPDVGPQRYGADAVDPRVTGVDPAHDALDLHLASAAVALDLPVLAVCRGHQVLNVALGGTLVQHIDDHRFVHHEIRLEPGCRVARAIGHARPVGHCVHHQAIDRLGTGLVATGWAEDGTIEAVERDTGPGGWVVGVQWHPEDTADDDPDQQRLFDGFVGACRDRLAVT